MKWSPSVQGFFFENNSDIPDDAFDIEDALYYELMNGQSTGKIIINTRITTLYLLNIQRRHRNRK